MSDPPTITQPLPPTNIDTTTTTTRRKQLKKTVNIPQINNVYLSYTDFYRQNICLRKYKLSELKTLAKFHKLHISGTKPILIDRILKHFHLNMSAIKIQKTLRVFFVKRSFHLRGGAFKNRTMCVNNTDFFTLEPLDEIPFQEFFSYTDESNFTYGFNIQSLMSLLKRKGRSMINPYNRTKIPESVIGNMIRLYLYLIILFPENVGDEEKIPASRNTYLQPIVISLLLRGYYYGFPVNPRIRLSDPSTLSTANLSGGRATFEVSSEEAGSPLPSYQGDANTNTERAVLGRTRNGVGIDTGVDISILNSPELLANHTGLRPYGLGNISALGTTRVGLGESPVHPRYRLHRSTNEFIPQNTFITDAPTDIVRALEDTPNSSGDRMSPSELVVQRLQGTVAPLPNRTRTLPSSLMTLQTIEENDNHIRQTRQRMNEIRSKPINTRIQELFMEIDQLGNYTNVEWFTNLSIQEILLFYNQLHDLWRFRGRLSFQFKNRICPLGDPFVASPLPRQRQPLFDSQIEQLHGYCLNIMESLVFTASDVEDRRLGTLYVLIALTYVSIPARTALPWLYESMY
jgi:hypothetical protein